MYEISIVGSGLAGSTAARILAEAGYKVLVIERLKYVAGHCHDQKDTNNIIIHTYGPHIFHTNNKKVWDFVNRFTEFHYYQHRVLSYVEGKFMPFPINRDTVAQIFGIELATYEVEEFLRKEVKKSKYNDPPKNFKDVVVSQVGERLYELFFKNYTIKQWGRDPEELFPDVAKRIPVRTNRDDRYFSDKYQDIPKEGYTINYFCDLRSNDQFYTQFNIDTKISSSWCCYWNSNCGIYSYNSSNNISQKTYIIETFI